MPKATHFTRRKSHGVRTAAINENSANITFEQFKTLAVIPIFSKMSLTKNQKMTFEPGDYARFLGDVLEGRGNDIQPHEYWVGKIKEIRRSKTAPGSWLHVEWLWSAKEIKDLGVKGTAHMGKWERAFCTSASQSETVVHSDTVEAPTEVYTLNEHTYNIPDSGVFYVRSMFDYSKKTLKYLDNVDECKCTDCGTVYNPDDSHKRPLRYCATCKLWSHTDCGKATDRRLVKSTQFSNPQHYGKGLLLSGVPGDPVRPGPKSIKARSVAARATEVNLKLVAKRVPKAMLTRLDAMAESRICRPLNGNIVGNKAYVIRAREWISEARKPDGWSSGRLRELEEWFKELTQEIAVEDLTPEDDRREAEQSALFVCKECDFPV